jgi:hypothetical protein
MWRVLIVAIVMILAAPGLASATRCRWAIDPGGGGDVISVMNQGTADTLIFQILDTAGTQQGIPVSSPSIPGLGRYETKVADVYAAAGLPTSAIKNTYILVYESDGREMILQVKTGGGTFQPRHFDSAFAGTGACVQD